MSHGPAVTASTLRGSLGYFYEVTVCKMSVCFYGYLHQYDRLAKTCAFSWRFQTGLSTWTMDGHRVEVHIDIWYILETAGWELGYTGASCVCTVVSFYLCTLPALDACTMIPTCSYGITAIVPIAVPHHTVPHNSQCLIVVVDLNVSKQCRARSYSKISRPARFPLIKVGRCLIYANLVFWLKTTDHLWSAQIDGSFATLWYIASTLKEGVFWRTECVICA